MMGPSVMGFDKVRRSLIWKRNGRWSMILEGVMVYGASGEFLISCLFS